MKLFHLSDLHIGLTLCSRDMHDDQEYVLNQIVDAVSKEKPDAVLIAGDIYDRSVPSAEAVSLCNSFIEKLVEASEGRPVMIISGNHDNCDRIDYLKSLAKKSGVYMVGNPPRYEDEFICKVTLEDDFGPINFYLLPFVKPTMVKNIIGVDDEGRNFSYDETIKRLIERETIDASVRNVLVSHQFYCPINGDTSEIRRSDSEIKVVGNLDAVSSKYLEVFDYAALGHIHTPMTVGKATNVYCGTPIACSVSEAGQKKAIVVVELGDKKDEAKITNIPLVPMHEVRKLEGTLSEILDNSSEDYVSIILTDKDEGIAQFNLDKVKAAFPNYLDISVKHDKEDHLSEGELKNPKQLSHLDFCKEFYSNMSDEELQIVTEIINMIEEEI
ncbi:MAG: exonuclease SbcCD subunit D [Clostridia bacterium]|nr:exonuclease SbcCD subunit D [Clostridia bacterium]